MTAFKCKYLNSCNWQYWHDIKWHDYMLQPWRTYIQEL